MDLSQAVAFCAHRERSLVADGRPPHPPLPEQLYSLDWARELRSVGIGVAEGPARWPPWPALHRAARRCMIPRVLLRVLPAWPYILGGLGASFPLPELLEPGSYGPLSWKACLSWRDCLGAPDSIRLCSDSASWLGTGLWGCILCLPPHELLVPSCANTRCQISVGRDWVGVPLLSVGGAGVPPCPCHRVGAGRG